MILFEICRRDGCSVLFEYRVVYNRNDCSWNKNVLNRRSYGVYYFINEQYNSLLRMLPVYFTVYNDNRAQVA